VEVVVFSRTGVDTVGVNVTPVTSPGRLVKVTLAHTTTSLCVGLARARAVLRPRRADAVGSESGALLDNARHNGFVGRLFNLSIGTFITSVAPQLGRLLPALFVHLAVRVDTVGHFPSCTQSAKFSFFDFCSEWVVGCAGHGLTSACAFGVGAPGSSVQQLVVRDQPIEVRGVPVLWLLNPGLRAVGDEVETVGLRIEVSLHVERACAILVEECVDHAYMRSVDCVDGQVQPTNIDAVWIDRVLALVVSNPLLSNDEDFLW